MKRSIPLSEKGKLPETPGVYFVMIDDVVLYIGKAINLRSRWKSHHIYPIVSVMDDVRICWEELDEAVLLSYEAKWINYYRPPLNRFIPKFLGIPITPVSLLAVAVYMMLGFMGVVLITKTDVDVRKIGLILLTIDQISFAVFYYLWHWRQERVDA